MALGAYIPGLGAPGGAEDRISRPVEAPSGPVRAPRAPAGKGLPPNVLKRLQRGRKVMMRDAPKRRLCIKFEKGETYWKINEKNLLVQQNTITFSNGGGKPPYRIRNRYNFIRPLVDSKVSASTQKIPSYDVSASTTDPKDIGAANIARKVAVYGYDKWRLKEAARKAVKSAVVTGDAFAWPYFDTNVGPFVELPDGRVVGQGEIKVVILNGNQVYWEPGVSFENSGWFAVEQALPIEDVEQIPGFIGIPLLADGSSAESMKADKSDSDNLVRVTKYFERPCVQYPQGRYLCIANNLTITPEQQYPLQDRDGNVIDEPLLHRLVYTTDPDSDHDLGLVWQLIDLARTAQDCYNKLLEWKNRVLNPQMLAPENSMQERRNDIPGYVYHYKPIGNLRPEWEQPVTTFVQPLQAILEQVKSDMQYIAADQDIAGILAPNVSTSSIQATIEQSANRWQAFLADLADWHSRLMRHCLLLVSKYYDEPRLIQIRGERGVDNIQDFLGTQILDQVNVTVLPGSLESQSRQQVLQEVMGYVDRQMISPRQAMLAVQARSTDVLTYSWELDVRRANTIIQRILDGTAMDMPERETVDPSTGNPIMVPSWMPTASDNADVWEQIFSDWMKTEEFEELDSGHQEIANLIYSAIIRQRLAKAQLEAQMQMQMAQQLGMQNAAKPASAGVPSSPGSAGTPAPQ
jgi:hypothetical protein